MTGTLGIWAIVASLMLVSIWGHRRLVAARAARRLEVSEGAGSGEGRAWELDDPGLAARLGGLLRSSSRVGLYALATAAGALAAAVAWGWLGLPLEIALAVTLDVAILVGIQVENVHARRLLRIEEQLAEALRLTAAGLRAGMGRIDSLQRSAGQVEKPLRPLLADAVGRLRLGEAPEAAFGRLAHEVPLDSARLLALMIGAQWHAGGSLQGTLASVGEFMQDRVEVARRIESQTAATRSSILLLVGATGAIAWFSWNHDPAGLERFVRSSWGESLVAATLALQGLSLLWMNRLMRLRV